MVAFILRICLDKHRETTKYVLSYEDKVIAKDNTINIANYKEKDNKVFIAKDNTNKSKSIESDIFLTSNR